MPLLKSILSYSGTSNNIMTEVAMNIINLIDDLGALGIRTKGHCKEEFFFQKSEFTMEVGGWVGRGLTRNFFF